MHNFPEESFIIYVVRLIVNISTNRFPENPESWGQLTLPAKGKKKMNKRKSANFVREKPHMLEHLIHNSFMMEVR